MICIHYLDPNPENDIPVVFLHGLGSDANSWVMQAPALAAAGFRPILLDLPGFGRSVFSGQRWSIAVAAHEIVKALPFDSFVMVGLSLGGVVAQEIALIYPEKVTHLILINTFAALRPTRLDDIFYFVKRFVIAALASPEQQAELVAKRVFPGNEQAQLRGMLVEQIMQADPKVYRAAMRQCVLVDYRRRLHSLKIPSLIITGDSDSTVSPAIQTQLARSIPKSKQVFITGGNHGMIVTHADEVNRALLEFLSEK